jgi:RNA polymerase sigma-70 factor, ECF subfamily
MTGTEPGPITQEILETLPSLRAFARSLNSNHAGADDLVQDCLARALANLDKFEPGTNLRAWLFTILRNSYYSDLRKRKREVEDIDGGYADRLSTPAGQLASLDMHDFRKALAKLTSEQREALILVGASGFSYDEAAKICDCAAGNIKSRVNRGRQRLSELLEGDPAADLTREVEKQAPVEIATVSGAGR